jgi:arginyl-tRNA--protein-N-Asp/Glu arginylyltransferase
MESLFRFVAPPSRCGYLPAQQWSLEYEYVGEMTSLEYLQRLTDNWRRFGHTLFRPVCVGCQACRSLRVRAAHFRPNRSQRRCRNANAGQVELRIGVPAVTRTKLALYDRYHAYQAEDKGWPRHPAKDAASYEESFVNHPFAVEEWCYYLGRRLVGVGYVDCMREKHEGGLSAIYYFYDPDLAERSLGTWNVLCVLEETRRRGLPYAYLGYHVEGCRSLEYKARFVPNQVREPDGIWRSYRE